MTRIGGDVGLAAQTSPPFALAPDANSIFQRNITALARVDPMSASLLRTGQPPYVAELTVGRDGSPTYAWSDEEGRARWLGRTSMPSISAPALVEAFQPGGGNVLLVGLAQGEEVRLLSDRLGRHQAIFVVEPEPWTAALALRLHDFSNSIIDGRLVLCAASEPWAALEEFLVRHPGYLAPERVLCRPWYDAAAIASLSQRLGELAANAAARRDYGALTASAADATRGDDAYRVALVTNLLDPHIRRLADNLIDAPASLGWSLRSYTLDSPSHMHPHASEAELAGFLPQLTLLLGIPPTALAYRLPATSICVIPPHDLRLADDWIKQLPATAHLVALSTAQYEQFRCAGWSETQICRWQPAARSAPVQPAPVKTSRVLVLCDAPQIAPEDAGLTLDTHRRIWSATERIIRGEVDRFTMQDVERVFKAATHSLGMTLKSEEVIAGLTARIRAVLAPGLVRQEYLQALLRAGIDFHIYGRGSFTDAELASRHRGPWPPGSGASSTLTEYAAAISFEPDHRLPDGLLDCAAAGLPIWIRRVGSDSTTFHDALPDNLESLMGLIQSRDELARSLHAFQRTPVPARERAAKAARLLNDAHTWAHRLQSLRARAEGIPAPQLPTPDP